MSGKDWMVWVSSGYFEIADQSAVVRQFFESAVDGEFDDGVGGEEVFELSVVVDGIFEESELECVVAEVADGQEVVGVVLGEASGTSSMLLRR